jgi:hypothetical protein
MGYLSRYIDELRAGWAGFNSWQEQQIFLFYTVSRPALRSIHPHIQWKKGGYLHGVRAAGA